MTQIFFQSGRVGEVPMLNMYLFFDKKGLLFFFQSSTVLLYNLLTMYCFQVIILVVLPDWDL